MKKTQPVTYILVLLIIFFFSPLIFAANTNKEAAEKYEQAIIAKQNGETKAAIIHLKNALQLDNNYIAAHILLGKLYLAENQGALAEKEFNKANALGADRSLTVVPLAEAYQQQYKYKDMIEKIFPVGYSRTTSAKLYILQGQAHTELNSFDDAIAAFNEAIKLNPDSVEGPLGLAAVYLQQGKLDEAHKYINQAKSIDANDPDVWYMQGSVFHAKGNLQEAEKYYTKVIQAEPEHMSALIARAGVLIDQGKNTQAYADIKKIRELNPNDPRAAYFQAVLLAKKKDDAGSKKALMEASAIIDGLSREAILDHSPSLLLAGLVKFSLGEYEKANDYLKNYVQKYPQNPSARKLLGSTLIKKQEYQSAIAVLEPALRVIPDDYKLLTMLGTAYMYANKHTLAAEMFDKALLLGNEKSTIRFKRALNQLAAGNKNTAIDELGNVFSENQTNDKAGVLLAILYIKKLQLDKALEITSQLVKKNPNNLTVLNLHASTLLANGDIAQAKKYLNKVISKKPDLISAQINLAKISIRQNRLDEAEEQLQALLKRHPGSDLIMHQLAIVSSKKGDVKTAQHWLEKAQAKNPQSINAAVTLMKFYLANNQGQKAVKVGEDIESRHPENLRVMDALGRSYLATGKIKTAQSVFRRMSLLANYNSRLLHRIAKLQLQAKDIEKAIWSLQKAVASDKNDLASHVLLVDVLIQNNQLTLAKKEAKIIVKRFPDQPQGYGLLGDIALAEGKNKTAINYYKKSLNIKQSSRATLQLARAYRQLGKNKAAENILRKWLRKQPKDVMARQGLAEHYLMTGNREKAAKHYRIIVKTGHENALALNNLAMIYADTDRSQALKYAKRAAQLAPNQASVIDTLGWLLVKNGEYKEGLTYLRDANARQANSAEIHYHIAIALNKLGRKTEAIRELKTAIDLNQTFDELAKAKKLLRTWEQ